MLATRLWTLCVGATVALTATSGVSLAQTSKAAAEKAGRTKVDDSDATKTADTEKAGRPAGPWNDPAMQLRGLKMRIGGGGGMPGMPGGGGGRGGPGGQGGGANAMIALLMQSPALQEEIAVSEEQKTQLKEVNDKSDKARRDLFSQMGGGRGGQNGGRGGQNGQRGQVDRNVMMEAMTQIGQATNASVSKILEKPQKDRLNEIELQIIGVTAVTRPDVAKRLNLSPPQMTQIQVIIEQMNTAQRELMASGMQGMRGNRGGQGGPGGQAGPGGAQGGAGNRRQPTTKNDAGDAEATKGETAPPNRRGGAPAGGDAAGGDNANGGQRPQRPDFNSPEMQERMKAMGDAMTKMNEEAEKIDKKVETAIAKVLTKGQKSKFNAMLGEKYDLIKLAQSAGGGRGGPGGQGGNRGGAGARGKGAAEDN